MRVILKCNRYTAIEWMFQKLEWMNVENYVKIQVLIFLQKVKMGLYPSYLTQLVSTFNQIHEHDARHRNNFF